MITATEKLTFIESVFGKVEVSRRGTDVAVRCPFCTHLAKEKKKLAIRLSDDANHCWVCGWASRNLLALIRKCGTSEQYAYYRTKFVPHIKFSKEDDATSEQESKVILPNDFRLLVHCGKTLDPDVKAIFSYLRKRKVGVDDLWRFSIGVSESFIYKNRVIIPSHDCDGELNYFVTRTIHDYVKPKYKNPFVKKQNIVFNEFRLDYKKPLLIVEGVFDLLKCPTNATCLLGSTINENFELFSKILENETKVILMLDSDMKTKAQTIAKKLYSYNIEVKLANIPSGYDPGLLTKEEVIDIMNESIMWQPFDMFEHKLSKLTTSFSIGI